MNNAAAIGYAILAAKRANFDYELIKVLENLMRIEMTPSPKPKPRKPTTTIKEGFE